MCPGRGFERSRAYVGAAGIRKWLLVRRDVAPAGGHSGMNAGYEAPPVRGPVPH